MNYSIRLTLELNPNGVYTVTSPDVPGLVTEGTTLLEIQANVQDAFETLLLGLAELGRPLPVSLQSRVISKLQNIDMLVTA
jgi:antitoxin HicB